MASKYWLKLYHEILDDPKVMTLRPALRWRFVETLLMAGEADREGLLPSPRDYAWRVRSDFEQTESEFIELVEVGLLSINDGEYRVTKFKDRQAAVSGAERVRRHRKTQRLRPSNEPVTPSVTNRYTDTDKIRIDRDVDKSASHTFLASPDEYIPEDTTALINALATHTSADILLDAEKIRDIAEAFVSEGVTAEQVEGFPAWWDEEAKQAKKNNKSYPYIGRPALKSLRRHWPEYVNGTTASEPVAGVDFKVFTEVASD